MHAWAPSAPPCVVPQRQMQLPLHLLLPRSSLGETPAAPAPHTPHRAGQQQHRRRAGGATCRPERVVPPPNACRLHVTQRAQEGRRLAAVQQAAGAQGQRKQQGADAWQRSFGRRAWCRRWRRRRG